MPVTIGEDTHHLFSRENDMLPEEMVAQFITPLETGPVNEEFVEYLPCFSIEKTEPFVALVWWKADLLNYEYTLATFTQKGELIAQSIIAFTRVDGGRILRRVASINEEWEIFLAEAESPDGTDLIDPTKSKTAILEILSNGQIVN